MTAATTSSGPLTAGVDIGGTKTALVVTDADERLLHVEVVATDQAQLVEQVVELVRHVAAQRDGASNGAAVAAVGVATPGHVDSAAGTVTLALNLGLRTVALRAAIEEALGLRCVVEHDARAAAIWLFERAAREGRAPHGLAYLSIGTGIAAGIVIDGRPISGANGLAGEVGHVIADPAGPLCVCGLRGCLEALAAGPAIARRAAQAVATSSAASLPAGPDASPPAGPTAHDVFRLAANGDETAGQVITEAAAHLARALRALALGYGVDQIVIGGGVAHAGAALRGPLLAAIAAERRASALIDHVFATTTVELLPADRTVAARGAALLARRLLAGGPAAAAEGKGVAGRD